MEKWVPVHVSPPNAFHHTSLFDMISNVWGILWNSADKMANSKIYLISEGNPHRFVHLRIHGHLAVLHFF